jgi:hypothetical protein
MMNNGQSVTIDGSTKKQVIKDIEISNDEYQTLLSKQFDDLMVQTINQVDSNTKALFGKGFQYQDMTFSMSQTAISKISSLQLALLRGSDWDTFLCNDLKNENSIKIKKNNAQAFIDAFATQYLILTQSDATLKEAVRKIKKLNDLQAFVDPRMV